MIGLYINYLRFIIYYSYFFIVIYYISRLFWKIQVVFVYYLLFSFWEWEIKKKKKNDRWIF